jgi:hypothetical protein
VQTEEENKSKLEIVCQNLTEKLNAATAVVSILEEKYA